MAEQRFDAITKLLASGISRRTIVKALIAGAIPGVAPSVPDHRRGRFSQPSTARAASQAGQVVTPEPTMPPFNNNRGVLPIDYVSNPDPNVPGLASGHVENGGSFPVATVRVQNDRAFWLDLSVVHQDKGVAIIKNGPDYAQYGLIAPHKSATYAARFAPDTTSELDFGVDGGARRPVYLTIVQVAVELALLLKGVTKENLGEALIEVVTEEKVAQLDQATVCMEAVRERSVDKLRQCLESPLLQETAQDVLAKALSPQDFSDLQGLALSACPALSEQPAWLVSCKVLSWTDFALKFNDIYAGWSLSTLSGSVKFLGFVTGQPHVIRPGGVWIAPDDGTTVTDPALQLAARAYPSHTGDPAIARVQFTGWWPAVGPKEGPWRPLCAATTPTQDDVYQCEADLSRMYSSGGPLTISFDVYDQGNHTNYAPNGEHAITWTPAPSPSAAATSLPQPTSPPATPPPSKQVDPTALVQALGSSTFTQDELPPGYSAADTRFTDPAAVGNFGAVPSGSSLGEVVFLVAGNDNSIVYNVFTSPSDAQAGLVALSQSVGRMGLVSVGPMPGFNETSSTCLTGYVQGLPVAECMAQVNNVLVAALSAVSGAPGQALTNAQDLVNAGITHLNRVLQTM